MSATDSLPAKRVLAIGWLVFAGVDLWLMYRLPGEETIPYHLIWASFGFLYGLVPWSRTTTLVTFWATTVATADPLVRHARAGAIGFSECSEIVLMGVLVSMLIWHVNRHRRAQQRISELREDESARAHNRELAARLGSHEVRTRLTIARGFVELIHDATADGTIRNDSAIVLTELDKALALANNVLTLVRVDATSPRDPIDLDDQIESIARRWAAAAGREWSASSSVGVILGDAERIEAALDCLIENAVKFTTAGDSIRIEARLQAGDVVLSVEDTGAGIPPEDLERVFDIFQTGSSAGERAGAGLGLAIVGAVVRAREGTLEVSSTVGVGSCFTIRIPANPSERAARVVLMRGPESATRHDQAWENAVVDVT
jgi:signal transduction histidine kinase